MYGTVALLGHAPNIVHAAMHCTIVHVLAPTVHAQ